MKSAFSLKFRKPQFLQVAVVFAVSFLLLAIPIFSNAAPEQDESENVFTSYVDVTKVLIIDIKESLFGSVGAIQNQAAVLSSLPASNTVNVGDTFAVNVSLDTTGVGTDGVDIRYLNFDPALLAVQQITPGALYSSTQVNTFNNTTGTINFAQVTTGGSTYSGSGTLATITFLAKAAGNATLTFDFTLNNTTDTNVASGGSDVLTSATGASYTISDTSVPPPPPPPPSTKFTIGDRVQTTSTLNIRATANGTLLGTQSLGAQGAVIGGPTSAGGFTWWNVNFDTGVDGWGAEDWLVKATAPPPPPPSTCTSFTYSSWSPTTCPSNQTQTRTVLTSSPSGCTGGTPILTQSCTYIPPSSGTITSRVSQSSDDAEENVSTGAVNFNSSDIELVTDGTTLQVPAMRFKNITIPQGATITSASIEFETDETDTGTTNLTFYGEDIDNSQTFTTATNNISNRPKTSSSVSWNNIPAWNTVSQKHQTTNISSIIQEIINRSNWQSGNSLSIIVTGTGKRTAESYDGESVNAPLLTVTYDTTLPPPPPPPPSTKFTIGDRVQTTSTLNIRATANGTLLGTQSLGAQGAVIGGPTSAGGFTWWNVNFDTGVDGWGAEDWLVKATAPPPPPPSTCTSFTYSSWSPTTCPSNQTQTRTVLTSSPSGCTGGTPILTQSCTYIPPPPPPPTSRGVVGNWTFNEGSGATLSDSSGNGNTGTLTGSVFTTNSIAGNSALSFDGNGDYVEITDNPTLDITDEITLEAWVYPTALIQWDVIISKATPTYANPYFMYALTHYSNTQKLRFVISIGGTQYQALSQSISTNQWYYVVGTYSDTDNVIKIYINGVLANSLTASGLIDTNNKNVRIGGYEYVPSESWNGYIDEVSIYNKALTGTEIQTKYNALAPIAPPPPPPPPADVTPPIISNIQVVNIAPTTATITWTTNEASDTQVEYGQTTTYAEASNLNTALTTSHSDTITGLSSNTLYHYRVKSTDASSNSSISTDKTFTTTTGEQVDTTAPSSITDLATSFINHTSITLNWSAPGDDGALGTAASYDIRYSTSTIAETNWVSATLLTGEPTPKASGSIQSYTVAGLSPSTTYYFAIKSKDEVPNTSAISNIASNTTHSITIDPILGCTDTSATNFNQNATEDDGTCTYPPPPVGGGGGGGGGGSGGGVGGSYFDTIAPEKPSNFTAEGADQQITLEWNNPKDGDFVRVILFRSAQQIPDNTSISSIQSMAEIIYEGTEQEHTDVGLNNNTTYYYAIYAHDKRPNYTGPTIISSAPVTGKTTITKYVATQTTGLTSGQTTGQVSYITSNLYIGQNNDETKLLQQLLSQDAEIYPEAIISGYYGSLTQNAVERFQCKYMSICSGAPDENGYGIVGPMTRAKINEVFGGSGGTVSTQTSTTIPRSGLTQSQIDAILNLLKSFDAEQDVIDNVRVSLEGGTTQTSSTQTTTNTASSDGVTGPFGVGMTSEQVTLLQQLLSQDAEIYPEAIISGYYGSLTQNAVERFQCKYMSICSGAPDENGYGLAGPSTRTKLNEVF